MTHVLRPKGEALLILHNQWFSKDARVHRLSPRSNVNFPVFVTEPWSPLSEDHVSSHARTRSVPTCFFQMNRTTVPSLVQTVNSRAAKASTLGRGIVQETMLQHRNRPVHYRKPRYDNKTSGHFRLKLCSDNDTVPVDDPTESKMTWLVRFSYGFTTRGGDQYQWGEHNKLLANV